MNLTGKLIPEFLMWHFILFFCQTGRGNTAMRALFLVRAYLNLSSEI
jgi:hypothetical protein